MDSPDITATSQKEKDHAILVIDKSNVFGEQLISHLPREITPVLVSDKEPDKSSTIIHINAKAAVLHIPDTMYTHMVFFWQKELDEWVQPFLKKAAETQATCLVVVSREKLHEVSSLSELKQVASLLLVGDVFGENEAHFPLDKWLHEIKQTKKVMLENMGLSTWYPVAYEDAVETIAQALFSHVKKGETYIACSEHVYTSLSISHALQKEEPFLQIDLQDQTRDTPSLPQGKYLLEKSYPVLEKIVNRYKELPFSEKEGKVYFPEFSKKQKHHGGHKKSRLSFFLYGFFVFLIVPLLIFAGSGGLGAYTLYASAKDIENGKLTSVQAKLFASRQLFQASLVASQVVFIESTIVGQQGQISRITQQLQTAETIAEGLTSGVQSYQTLQRVLLGKTLTPKEDVISAVNSLRTTTQAFEDVASASLPQAYQPTFAAYKEGLGKISSFADTLPSIIGAGEDRTYAVLFQNNMELRPGGGFIGSYGLIKLHNGKFKSFTIHDVYDSDGQLKGHVEPPFAIRRYIPLVHLYLRDSNFDVDGTSNAKEEAFLLNQETGERVNGIITVDLSFMKALLSLTGGIYIPTYNQTVTNDNFFLLTEKHAEKNFFPGSSQKKDFLNTFFDALLQKVESKHMQLSKSAIDDLVATIQEKHVLVAFADPSVEEPFTYLGYSSSLWDGRSNSPQTVNDFLGINEANLGVNKANYFVKRSIAQKVLVNDKGEIHEAVGVTYINSSNGEWPGGPYRNFIRFILPLNTILQEVTINNQVQKIVPAITDPKVYEARGFAPPKGLEVQKYNENGKTIYGFLFMVPEKSSLTISLAYQLADTVATTSQSATYSLKLFKQPGIDSFPYTLEVAYPKSFTLLPGTKGFSTTKSVVDWKGTVTKDEDIIVPFTSQ